MGFGQSLGLIIPRGLCVSDNMIRASFFSQPFVSDTGYQNALTEKVSEVAVKGLGKNEITTQQKVNCLAWSGLVHMATRNPTFSAAWKPQE